MGDVVSLHEQRLHRVVRERCRACAHEGIAMQDARFPMFDQSECPACGKMEAEPTGLRVFDDNGTGAMVPVMSAHQTLDAWRPRAGEIVLVQLGEQIFALAVPVATVLAERLNAALQGRR